MIDAYEAYGQAARNLTTPTLIAGRNRFQAEEEKNIVRDVAEKLRLCPAHRLLEVGCNIGILLTPLSPHVAEAVDQDVGVGGDNAGEGAEGWENGGTKAEKELTHAG